MPVRAATRKLYRYSLAVALAVVDVVMYGAIVSAAPAAVRYSSQVTDENRAQRTDKSDFRDYGEDARDTVRATYRANHLGQTLDFVLDKKRQYLGLDRAEMSVWEALRSLEALVDESDPDSELPQIQHALQTAEAIRAAGEPRWFQLTGFIHDLGKVLCLFGEPQWAVVGDTFPVGCAFAEEIVYPELFEGHPDLAHEDRSSINGIYQPGCGLDNVHLSFGHDEYLYQVMRPYLPMPALAMIRYHSFYAWHTGGAYRHLMQDSDEEQLGWVRRFNPYDLYSKSATTCDLDELRPYYEALVDEFLPPVVRW